MKNHWLIDAIFTIGLACVLYALFMVVIVCLGYYMEWGPLPNFAWWGWNALLPSMAGAIILTWVWEYHRLSEPKKDEETAKAPDD